MKIRHSALLDGVESFDDRILANLNKGLDVETNLRAIRLMRRIKEEFPEQWGYARSEGSVHGFIHPTPWDTPDTERNNRQTISLYALGKDILPDRSVPLIIHHASALGDWMQRGRKDGSHRIQERGIHYCLVANRGQNRCLRHLLHAHGKERRRGAI